MAQPAFKMYQAFKLMQPDDGMGAKAFNVKSHDGLGSEKQTMKKTSPESIRSFRSAAEDWSLVSVALGSTTAVVSGGISRGIGKDKITAPVGAELKLVGTLFELVQYSLLAA